MSAARILCFFVAVFTILFTHSLLLSVHQQGRTFDGHMLDMVELGLVGYRGLEELPGLAKRVGSKPAFVFVGEKWGREEAYRKLQNILLGKQLLPVLTPF